MPTNPKLFRMPAPSYSPQPSGLGRFVARLTDYTVHYAVEILLVAALLYLCFTRGLSIGVDVREPEAPPEPVPAARAVSEAGMGWISTFGEHVLSGLLFGASSPATEEPGSDLAAPESFGDVALTDDPAPHISNLTLILSPDYGRRKGLAPEIIAAKRQRVGRYLNRHAAAARREMETFGIPASITLAQALLESNAGDSKLAVNSNNHFGIKCRSKCLGCTCRNYGDDTRYDMFRVFDSVADSYREHSLLLTTPRYARLHQYGTDFRKWAHGLKACGYATDKRYAEKLITIIENLELDRFDRARG